VVGTYTYLQRSLRVRNSCSEIIAFEKPSTLHIKKCEGKGKAETIVMLYCGNYRRKYRNGMKQDVRVATRIESGGVQR
jgi:hypothetical protein